VGECFVCRRSSPTAHLGGDPGRVLRHAMVRNTPESQHCPGLRSGELALCVPRGEAVASCGGRRG
jgi:hypothetical protein